MVSPQVCFWEGQMFTKKAPKNIDMSQKQIAVETLRLQWSKNIYFLKVVTMVTKCKYSSPLIQWKSGLIKGLASLEGENYTVFYYLNVHLKTGLKRGVAFDGSILLRRVSFERQLPYKKGQGWPLAWVVLRE